ncbi:MAG: response regulator transcription factor [Verrucomicrobiales bacterium]|jgi:DNA-binding response OmpR family regulator|nr:response regulator transcription factor [Verrucomicrobiales bacterium]
MRLLLVEDSNRLRSTLVRALARLGHAVDEAADGNEADLVASLNHYDMIILDLMLPGRSGLELLESWRRKGDNTPVIILTAMNAIEDRVRGLALGADDYLVKPFALAELAARIEAIVRRHRGKSDSRVRVGEIEIDFAARTVWRKGEEVVLTAREFSLLECLARRLGQILSREQIEAHLYNEAESPLSNAVDAAIYSLRRKLSPDGAPLLIQTRRGLGYVMQESS